MTSLRAKLFEKAAYIINKVNIYIKNVYLSIFIIFFNN